MVVADTIWKTKFVHSNDTKVISYQLKRARYILHEAFNVAFRIASAAKWYSCGVPTFEHIDIFVDY